MSRRTGLIGRAAWRPAHGGYSRRAVAPDIVAIRSANSPQLLLAVALAPLRKGAFGVAVGVTSAGCMLALTLFHLVAQPRSDAVPALLGQYLYGYAADGPGLLIGPAWGFGIGFVAGVFLAAFRNMALGVSVFLLRSRVELARSRDFLDHL